VNEERGASPISLVRLRDLRTELPAGHSGVDSRPLVREPELVFQECLMSPGGSADGHAHEALHQVLFVLEGQLELTGADGTVTAGPNQMIVVPAGAFHSAANREATDCRYLVVTYPATRT
jgi:mannose-6-phosphate isomerase-like protein (cupin superfamily)